MFKLICLFFALATLATFGMASENPSVLTAIAFTRLIFATLAIIVFATTPVKARKVGGIRFLKIGRYQFSYCITRANPYA